MAALSARAETYEDIPLPEGGGTSSSSALSSGPKAPPSPDDLFGAMDFASPSEGETVMETETPPEGTTDAAFDFSAFLDSIPEDLTEPTQPPATEEASPDLEAPSFEAPTFDLPAEEDGLPPLEAPIFSEEAAAPPTPEDAGQESVDFGIPDGLLDGFAEDVEAGREDKEQSPAADISFDDFDISAAFGAGEGAPAQPQEEEAVESGPASAESIEEVPGELPDMFADNPDSFSLFSEEAPSAEPPAQMESDTGFPPEPEVPQEATAEGQAGGAADEFAIPDFSTGMGSDEDLSFDSAPVPDDVSLGGAPTTPTGEPSFDSFDTFSLDNDFLSSGFGETPEKEAEGAQEEGFANLEDFSLEGIDDVFRGAQGKAAAPVAPSRKSGRARPSAEVEEIVLSEQDVEKLQATLASYPLNLRIACEELIAEHAVPPEDMSALVRCLVRGALARETAALASRLIGRSIPIPRGFEKRTGAELEAERATFAYAFTHNILPVLRIFAFVAVLAASIVYLGFEFIYRPLRATAYYKQGIERIGVGEYARANERFDQGFRLLRSKPWFYKYARSFADAKQYILAEEKFDQLLKLYPRDKTGALQYAEMESKELRNYEKADRILREQILDYSVEDREGLLAQGDNNLAWAELDPSRYEEARKAFARLMEKYGRRDEFLERMLLYFIRTDKLAEVLPLQDFFLSSEKRKISGSSLAELGGYLLDKKEEVPVGVSDANVQRIENLRKLLERAVRTDPAHPESYYHLARYFERYGKGDDERSALERALAAFAAANELSGRRTGYRIDAHRRYASLLTRAKEFLPAEAQLVEGIRLYEDALHRKILSPSANFGRLYADLGDLEYFKSGDLDSALSDYREAALNGWSPPEIRYRMGYIGYAQGNWEAAVESFFDASTAYPLNRRLMFALGNALFRRGDLHAAQGYYSRLLDMLEAERSRFPVLVPSARPDHAELAERLMRARNNLGVTLAELAERTGDARYRARALALYSESARAWDALSRDPATMVRSAQTNLAFLNTRGSLYPKVPYEAQIYAEIDKDVQEPSDWEKILAE